MKSVWVAKRVRLALGLLLLFPAIAISQDTPETTEKPTEVESLSNVFPAEIINVIDVEQAATAVRESDEETLLALAEKLGDPERGFPRPGSQNAAIQAQISFFKGSINACRIKRDAKSLESIGKSIDASKTLPPPAKGELKAFINVTKAAIASGRRLNPGPDLKVGEASPESVAIYNAFLDEISVTEEYGTAEDVAALEAAVKQLKELHVKQRNHLLSLLKDAATSIADRGAAEPTLALLASSSRSLSSGLKIVGPSIVRAGTRVHLTIISAGPTILPTGKEKLTLVAQASHAKVVGPSGKFEFTGKPVSLVVEVGNSVSPADKPTKTVCSVALLNAMPAPGKKSTAICQWTSNIQPANPRK